MMEFRRVVALYQMDKQLARAIFQQIAINIALSHIILALLGGTTSILSPKMAALPLQLLLELLIHIKMSIYW